MPPTQNNELNTTLAHLITAHHILHHKSILSCTGYGGVNVRNPLNHNVFFSSDEVGTSAGCVEGVGELRGWGLDGSPLPRPLTSIPTTPPSHLPTTSEHHIPASLFSAYPSLTCVIHLNHPILLSYACPGSPPLRAISNLAAFLGECVPVFDVARRYPSSSTKGMMAGYLGGFLGSGEGDVVVEKGHKRDLCINTKPLGDALAAAFALPASASSSALEMAKSLSLNPLSSTTTSSKQETGAKDGKKDLPDFTVLLLRGNGAVVVGTSIQETVFRAVVTIENAIAQRDAMLMHAATIPQHIEMVSRGGGGGQHGEGKGEKMGGTAMRTGAAGVEGGWNGGLSGEEIRDSMRMVTEGRGEVVKKAWKGWVREVRRSERYVNELDELVVV